jgi:hydroxyacyl-ACP dehydratase HTD2-like protein with hotdog domain
MGKRPYLTSEIRALVGEETTFRASEPVDPGKIRRFVKALGFENPAYLNPDENALIAPLTFVFSVNHDSLGEVDESGRPLNRLSLPQPFGPAIRGGNEYQFFRPVKSGDWIQVQREIIDLQEKQGRSGPMAILTYELKYTNQKGDLLGVNRETLIFRVIPDLMEGEKNG